MNKTKHPAVVSVEALVAENERLQKMVEQLSLGAATQAKALREFRDRNDELRANLDIQTYNVEFLKHQARKTRVKHRAEVRRLKDARDGAYADALVTHNAVVAELEREVGLLRGHLRLWSAAFGRL